MVSCRTSTTRDTAISTPPSSSPWRRPGAARSPPKRSSGTSCSATTRSGGKTAVAKSWYSVACWRSHSDPPSSETRGTPGGKYGAAVNREGRRPGRPGHAEWLRCRDGVSQPDVVERDRSYDAVCGDPLSGLEGDHGISGRLVVVTVHRAFVEADLCEDELDEGDIEAVAAGEDPSATGEGVQPRCVVEPEARDGAASMCSIRADYTS